MRVDVKKFIFVGLEKEKAQFFRQAQNAGFVHFIPFEKEKEAATADVSKIVSAIKVLRGLPTIEQMEYEEYALSDGFVYKILQLKDTISKLEEEQRLVRLEIARIGIFGDFSLQDIAAIEREGKQKVQFFCSKHRSNEEQPLPDNILYIGSDFGLDYFMSINPEPMQFPKMVEMRIDRSLGMLKARQTAIESEIHEAFQRLKDYAKYNTFLHHALVHKLNTHNLKEAIGSVQQEFDNSLFVVAGWVPVNKIPSLHDLLLKSDVHGEEVEVEPTDVIPTCLENHGVPRLGEELVHIYDTPSSNDKDPSLWVLCSFALFFSFIVGDGGYGLIFLAAALFFRFKYSDLSGAKRRLVNLATIVGASCLIWGTLTSSFFGMSLGPENPIRKYSLVQWLIEKKVAYHIEHKDDVHSHWVGKFPQLKDVEDPYEFVRNASTISEYTPDYVLMNKFSDNLMLELALFLGVVHILISMFRYLPRNWIMLGWIFFVIGGYLYFPDYLEATSMTQYLLGIDTETAANVGFYLMIGGVSLAVIIAIFKSKLLGILEVMTSIQIFADILSYLRLYALGLSGAIVGATINETAGGLPIVFGALLIFAGHIVNILLSVMSGTIHGLRLNFLEWYHYSFEGGGKMFNPLRKLRVNE